MKPNEKQKKKILIVDDDSTHRLKLRCILGNWGYKVFEADDGSTAIDKIYKQAFDLVLMDIRMHKISGLEALAEIKSFNPNIPVILITAYSSRDLSADARKKGAYYFLTKPFDFYKLRTVIKQALA
jgi:two-component system response regulator HydG